MISVWYQLLDQNANDPDKEDMYRLRTFADNDVEALNKWTVRSNIKVERITTDDLVLNIELLSAPPKKKGKKKYRKKSSSTTFCCDRCGHAMCVCKDDDDEDVCNCRSGEDCYICCEDDDEA